MGWKNKDQLFCVLNVNISLQRISGNLSDNDQIQCKGLFAQGWCAETVSLRFIVGAGIREIHPAPFSEKSPHFDKKVRILRESQNPSTFLKGSPHYQKEVRKWEISVRILRFWENSLNFEIKICIFRFSEIVFHFFHSEKK